MNNRETIAHVMKTFRAEYSGFDATKERLNIWCKILADIEPRHLTAAMLHILGENRQFPPNVGQLKHLAVNLAGGRIRQKTGIEAWEEIAAVLQSPSTGKPIIFSPDVKQAMNAAGVSLWDLRHANTGAFPAHRAAFIKSYDERQSREAEMETTAPEVRQLIGGNKRLEERN